MEPLEIQMAFSPDHAITASAKERTITGVIMTYNVVGYASTGPTIFEAGSVTTPDKLSKVKLLVQHDMNQPVGVLSSIEHKDNLVYASFTVPVGAAGDQALADAAGQLRDGLSVGAQILEYKYDDEGNLIVILSKLTEVSLVTVPAFEDALVNKVAAQRKGNVMELELDTPVVEAAVTPVAPVVTASVEVIERQAAPIVASNKGMSLTAAAAKVVDVMKAGGDARDIRAALADLVPADDAGKAFLKDQAIGELWTASRTGRPMIEAFNSDKLTGMLAYGWRWDPANKAQVARYAGNKTAVASGKIKTLPATGEAQDFAAGWDIARKYLDLGATGYIEAIFRQAVESYREQTDIWFGEKVIAAATAVPGANTVLGALTLMNVEAAKIGSRVSTLQFGTDVWEEFVNLKATEVPWWLTAQGEVKIDGLTGSAGGVKFLANPSLEGGQILGNDKNAATFYEAGTPVRVQALDIPNGGVDLGVFGYAANIIHDPRAILLGTVAV